MNLFSPVSIDLINLYLI